MKPIFKFVSVLTLALAFAGGAFAQSNPGVQRRGAVTPGHSAVWDGNQFIKDGGGAPIIPGSAAGGDLSGTYPNPTVAKLQTFPVAGTTPLDTQCLVYDGGAGQWQPGSCSAGSGVQSIIAGTGIVITEGTPCIANCTINLSNTITAGGPVGSATRSAIITYDAQGRLTAVSDAAIAPPFTAITGTLGCAQLPTFTGDVTNSLCALTIANNAVTTAKINGSAVDNSKLASMTAPSVKGAIVTGNPVDLTPAQITANFCNVATNVLKGCLPVLSGASGDYFGGDGAFHALPSAVTLTAGANISVGTGPNYTVAVTGTLPVANGGTGRNTSTANSIPINTGTTPQTETNVASIGSCLSAGPSFQSGCRILISTFTPSSVANVDQPTFFSTNNGFDDYEFVLENVLPANSGVGLILQVYVSGSLVTTGYSTYAIGTGASGFVPTTYIPLTRTIIGNTATSGVSGTFRAYRPNTAQVVNYVGQTGSATNASTYEIVQFGGAYFNGANPNQGFRLSFSTGNIASGTIKVYGLK